MTKLVTGVRPKYPWPHDFFVGLAYTLVYGLYSCCNSRGNYKRCGPLHVWPRKPPLTLYVARKKSILGSPVFTRMTWHLCMRNHWILRSSCPTRWMPASKLSLQKNVWRLVMLIKENAPLLFWQIADTLLLVSGNCLLTLPSGPTTTVFETRCLLALL